MSGYPLTAVIFDWAGTMLDFGCCAPAGVFVEVMRREGVDVPMAIARGPMGAEKRRHIELVISEPSVAARWREVKGRDWTQADVDAVHQAFIPLQLAILADYAELIPGAADAAKDVRARGLKIGSSTGYSREMMNIILPLAANQGYSPDTLVCSPEVPAGRPTPLMMYRNALDLNVWPMWSIVKVGDTVVDVQEGLNAGSWTVAVTASGNEVGLTRPEYEALSTAEQDARCAAAEAKLRAAGAHYVLRSVAELPSALDAIAARAATGERPS